MSTEKGKPRKPRKGSAKPADKKPRKGSAKPAEKKTRKGSAKPTEKKTRKRSADDEMDAELIAAAEKFESQFYPHRENFYKPNN